MASVTFRQVSKRFGAVVAVNELDLEVRDQEFLVLVGPSGCGKTTALRMLAGLEEQTSGEILIGDRIVSDLPPKDRDIAMVFQNYALYPHMTVFDNIAFGLKMRRVPRSQIDQRVKTVAEMLAIGHLLARRPKELSGGQRQRVAVGRAIAREPAVFLMDEPLSNLDAKLRIQTRAMLQRLHTQLRRTTVYVTHDQVEAMTMGHRIAVMSDGVLQQCGTPTDLYERPVNLFVAGFIGSPAMNVFPAKVVSVEGLPYADTGLFRAALPAYSAGRYAPEVLIGVRPEHLEAGAPGRDRVSLEARVEVIEFLGNELLIHLSGASHSFIARTAPSTTALVGTPIQLTFDLQRMHVFDLTTELAIR